MTHPTKDVGNPSLKSKSIYIFKITLRFEIRNFLINKVLGLRDFSGEIVIKDKQTVSVHCFHQRNSFFILNFTNDQKFEFCASEN